MFHVTEKQILQGTKHKHYENLNSEMIKASVRQHCNAARDLAIA
jgi:hypothetical protein